jgi:hypothetical protein
VALSAFVLAAALTSCSSFHEAPAADGGTDASAAGTADGSVTAVDGSVPVEVIRCGASDCPVALGNVCCATASGQTCMTTVACKAASGAPLECDDNADCVQLVNLTRVCCAIKEPAPSSKLLRAECILSSACDASTPRDQLCDPKGSPAQCDVAKDGRTACKPFAYSNVSGETYFLCVSP